jgi:surface protein
MSGTITASNSIISALQNSLPFITAPGVAITTSVISLTNGGAPISATVSVNTTLYVTVTVTYSSIPTADFGISFNTQLFKTWLVAANYSSGLSLLSISNVPLSTAGSQFAGITSIATIAIPIIRQGTSLANCFNGCTAFNSNISGWDTSNVTSMAYCFNGCSVYNNNSIALTWNTSKVTDMSFMFFNARLFNQAITSNMGSQYWNTSAVTTIANIFACITSGGAFNNGGSSMNWILTGLNGLPLTTAMVTTTSSSIYNWRGGVTGTNTIPAALAPTNAPVLLTTGPNAAFL